ncbi:hypothetical protein KIPB_010483, partial [Kipferlia bialata]|eukprot:g10483.t1
MLEMPLQDPRLPFVITALLKKIVTGGPSYADEFLTLAPHMNNPSVCLIVGLPCPTSDTEMFTRTMSMVASDQILYNTARFLIMRLSASVLP